MGRLIGAALAVLVGGCGTNVDLGDAKKDVNTRPSGTGGSSADAGVGPQGGTGENSAGGASMGGEGGAGGAQVAPSPMGAGGALSVPPPSGGACGMILPDPTPLPLLGTAEKNCAEAANATDWQLPLTSAGGADPNDKRASLVGRWVPCGNSPIGPAGISGNEFGTSAIEFGGNGRFRWLHNADGGLTPGTESGNFYFFIQNTGEPLAQLNLILEGGGGALLIGVQMRPNAQAFRENDTIYARTEPSPENGSDNPPSVRGKSCSLLGSWYTAGPSSQFDSFWFDNQGHFFGAVGGSDVCAAPTVRGTYELTPDDKFVITTARGMNQCPWWSGAEFQTTFSSTCDTVTLTTESDACGNGRGYLTGAESRLVRPMSR